MSLKEIIEAIFSIEKKPHLIVFAVIDKVPTLSVGHFSLVNCSLLKTLKPFTLKRLACWADQNLNVTKALV